MLKAYLKLTRKVGDKTGRLDVRKERAEVESMSGMFRCIGRIESQEVDAGGVPADMIRPSGTDPRRTILFLHGGSCIAGSRRSHRALAGNVAVASMSRVLLVDYRLAPEHPFPAALDDAVACWEWLVSQGNAPGRMAIVGDSAGGYLTLALLVSLRDKGRTLPAAGVCLSPVTDMTFSGPTWASNAAKDLMLDEAKEREAVRLYLGGTSPTDPLASPYFADLRGLPPILIQVGSHEMLLSDAERFTDKARNAGVDVELEVWPQMQHEWQFAASLLPEGRDAVRRIGAFLRGHVGAD
jgi:epsilon-lactone hydrolase